MEGATRLSIEKEREVSRVCGGLRHFCDGELMGEINIESGRGDYLVGRHRDCDIEIPDPTISYQHFRIYAIDYACDGVEFPSVQPLVFAEDTSMNGTYLIRAQYMADLAISRSIKKLSPADGAVLLNHKDRLQVSPQEYVEFLSVKFENVQLSGLSTWSHQEHDRMQIADHYTVSRRLIGVGGISKVHLGYRMSDGGQVACKIIKLNESTSGKSAKLPWTSRAAERLKYHVPEVEFLHDLQHPNIAAIERIFYNDSTAYIFQELIPAGDLLTYVVNCEAGRLDEGETASIVRQVLKAIAFLHSKQIVHRDLKPDNIMMTSLKAGTRIVLADFGHAKRIEENPEYDQIQSPQRLKRLFSVAGSSGYRAPEVERKDKDGYSGKSADMWSVGIIAAVILSGSGTFGLKEVSQEVLPAGDEIMRNAARANLRKFETDPLWDVVGPRPKDFIKKLVTPCVEQRLTAEKALRHCWFTNGHHAKFYENLYQFGVLDKWKQRPLENPPTVQLQASLIPPPDRTGDFLPERPDPHEHHGVESAAAVHSSISELENSQSSRKKPRLCHETASGQSELMSVAQIPSYSQLHTSKSSKRDGVTSHFFQQSAAV